MMWNWWKKRRREKRKKLARKYYTEKAIIVDKKIISLRYMILYQNKDRDYIKGWKHPVIYFSKVFEKR